jgi:hypothetical protein
MDCKNCTDCTYCTGSLRWDGSTAENLLSLNGLRWPVSTDGARIQIGCQNHSTADWQAFDDAAIVAMDGRDALRFWRTYKATILAMAQLRKDQS